jgi:hypothetical protein
VLLISLRSILSSSCVLFTRKFSFFYARRTPFRQFLVIIIDLFQQLLSFLKNCDKCFCDVIATSAVKHAVK